MSQAKFRPVLTASQITHLISLCRKDPSLESLSCLSVLGAFEYKIRNDSVSPAYSVATIQKRDMASELGFSEVVVVTETPRGPIANIPHDDEALYAQWMESPDGMSIAQLKRVQFYRYQTGKMMPDEESKYERETLGV